MKCVSYALNTYPTLERIGVRAHVRILACVIKEILLDQKEYIVSRDVESAIERDECKKGENVEKTEKKKKLKKESKAIGLLRHDKSRVCLLHAKYRIR